MCFGDTTYGQVGGSATGGNTKQRFVAALAWRTNCFELASRDVTRAHSTATTHTRANCLTGEEREGQRLRHAHAAVVHTGQSH